jgi:micrococcal nuclease
MRILLVLLLFLSCWVTAKSHQGSDANSTEYSSGLAVKDIANQESDSRFYQVKTVYDGDTVLLEDGRKIRFLGINTPEIEHHNKSADAGGNEAKRWLIDKLRNTKVRLEVSVEKTDKYGRTLAHVFTERNEHINLQLVEAGLAAVSIYPPDLLYVNELVKAQHQAEQGKLGIWARPEYAVMPVDSLSEAGHQGWTRLAGKVVNIRTSRKSIYLEFSDTFEARIERQWADLFPNVNDYLGKTIEVRGWLNKNNGHLTMLIRHPSAIKAITAF